MKTLADLVRGWLRKAESDPANTKMCLAAGQAFDTACFHAQQAAEKYLKAYLTAQSIEFPFIHNLEKLIDLCTEHNPEFADIKSMGQELTPYAVELRYDDEFWPPAETVSEALEAALTIKSFVLDRLPPEMRPEGDKL